MILWGMDFFTQLDETRIVDITGPLSVGKTLLAMSIAKRYLDHGYKLLTNVATVWADPLFDLYNKRPEKAVILVDEGGIYIRSAETVQALSSFSAKMNNYLIISGKKTPHEDLMGLFVEPVNSLFGNMEKTFGIPLHFWRYTVTGGRKSYGGLLVEGPRWDIYGVYDTLDPGDFPGGIVDTTSKWAEEYFEEYKRKYLLRDVARSRGEEGHAGENSLEDFQSTIRKYALSLQEGKGRRH